MSNACLPDRSEFSTTDISTWEVDTSTEDDWRPRGPRARRRLLFLVDDLATEED